MARLFDLTYYTSSLGKFCFEMKDGSTRLLVAFIPIRTSGPRSMVWTTKQASPWSNDLMINRTRLELDWNSTTRYVYGNLFFKKISWPPIGCSLVVFSQVTAPLVDYYAKNGVLASFHGTMSDVIYPEVKKCLESHFDR